MEVQVVLRKRGERCDLEWQALDTMELEPDARDFHDRVVTALVDRPTQKTLDDRRLGRGVLGRNRPAGQAMSGGAQEQAAASSMCGGRFEEVCCGGLSVGAGDADYGEPAGRKVLQRCGGPCQCQPCACDIDHGHTRSHLYGGIGDDARTIEVRGEPPSIDLCATDGDEQVAWTDLT